MARVNLTERVVVAARADPGTRLELWDERVPGLHLRVTDRGVKTWVIRYRNPTGQQPRLSLGKMPAFTLKDARERAAEVLREVAKGADPALAKRQARASPAPAIRTFDDLADCYEEVCAAGEWKPKGKRKKATVLAEETRILSRNVRPVLGKLAYASITRAEVKALLRQMVARGVNAQTNRTQAVIRQVFAFAISEDLAVINPATGFAPLAEETPRSRIWTDDELNRLWSALSDPAGLVDDDGKPVPVSEGMRIALKLAVVLGQRRAEVVGMERKEIDFESAVWTIPANRMKGSRIHSVPLSPDALTLIRRALEIADADRETPSPFVFPTSWSRSRAVMPDSMTRALQRLTTALKIEGATVHDLRRTVSTNLTSERCGVTPFIRSKVLGHLDAGGGAVVSSVHYDANSYLTEKRKALQIWSALLMEIVGERDRPSNVTAIHA